MLNRNRAKMGRGQIFTLDMIMAVAVFITILLTFYWLGSYTYEKIIVDTESEYVNEVSQQVANYLVTQRLTNTRNDFNTGKVEAFFNQSYDNQTRREIGAAGVDVRVRLYNNTGGLLYTYGPVPSSYDYLRITERLAIFNEIPARIKVEAWK